MRKPVGVLGLVLAVVLGLLSLTQFGAIQSTLQGLTVGPLNTYLGTLQFFWVLLIVLLALTGLASVVALYWRR